MQPLVSVNTHTHISLLSIHITPSTFLAALVLTLACLFAYIGSTFCIPSRIFSLVRPFGFGTRAPSAATRDSLVVEEVEEEFQLHHKTLPALPPSESKRSLLQLTQTPHASSRSSSSRGLRSIFSSRSKATTVSPSRSAPTFTPGSRPSSSGSVSAKPPGLLSPLNPQGPLAIPTGNWSDTYRIMTSMFSEASLDDIDFATPMSPIPRQFEYPPAHSGFGFSAGSPDVLDESDDNLDDSSISTGNYSPPAWRRLENGDRWYGNWRNGNDVLVRRALSKSKPLSPYYDTDVFEAARRTRLPTGSLSPEKGRTPEPDLRSEDDTLVKVKSRSAPPMRHEEDDDEDERTEDQMEDQKQSMMASMSPGAVRDNYIRFAVRADIQQRTEPIDAAFSFFQSTYRSMTKSWASMVLAVLIAMLSMSVARLLFQPAPLRPVPDLVKVAGLARSFEPLIYYSENGVSQVGDLQATGVAVWDLGESVRSSNMTSAPIIVKSLDELSDSLKTLAVELTRFFANVDGDIDSILIVMDWARRELSQLQSLPSPPLSTAFSNIHNILSAAGLLEDPDTGAPTKFGSVATAMFGVSHPQHTQQTLQRTFTEFLSVLEEAIESELQHSLALFGLFEAIDRQFLNLARLVVRESSLQDEQHADLLSSLWTRILGAKASEVKKYERNHELLANVREKTVRNKGILVEHNGKLLTLKANLENLRRKLVSPLVRSVNSSTLTLEDQIKGLEDVGIYLEGVRARQKGKLMEMLYGSTGSRRIGIAAGASATLIGDDHTRTL